MIANSHIRRIILFIFVVLIFSLVCDIIPIDFPGKSLLIGLLAIISGIWLNTESFLLGRKFKRTFEVFPFKKSYFPVYQLVPSVFLIVMSILIRKGYPNSALMFISIALIRLIQVMIYKIMNIFGLMMDDIKILENSDLVVEIPFNLVDCINVNENAIEWITIRKKNGPVIYLDKMEDSIRKTFLTRMEEVVKHKNIRICKPSDLEGF